MLINVNSYKCQFCSFNKSQDFDFKSCARSVLFGELLCTVTRGDTVWYLNEVNNSSSRREMSYHSQCLWWASHSDKVWI